MKTTITKFRQNIYKLIDELIDTGVPIEIDRDGFKIKVVLDKKSSKLSNLKTQKCINGNPEDIIHNQWELEWREKHI